MSPIGTITGRLDFDDEQYRKTIALMAKQLQSWIEEELFRSMVMGTSTTSMDERLMFLERLTQRLTEDVVILYGNLPISLSARGTGNDYTIVIYERVRVTPELDPSPQDIQAYQVIVLSYRFAPSLTLNEEYEIIREELLSFISTYLIEHDDDDLEVD